MEFGVDFDTEITDYNRHYLFLTLAWFMRSPTKVDTSTEPDMLPFLRISCFRNGNAAAGGSSGTVTV